MLDLTQIVPKGAQIPRARLMLPRSMFETENFLCVCRVSAASLSTTPTLATGRGHPHGERGEDLGKLGASRGGQMGCWQKAQSPPAGRCCALSRSTAANRVISADLHQKQAKEKT